MGGAYLDYGAATPIDTRVLDAMRPYLIDRFYNPSAPYELARGVRADVEEARGELARLVGGRPDNVTFTAGATEANNLAFACVSEDGEVVCDAIEHESVLACATARRYHLVGVAPDGRVDLDGMRAAIGPATELVSVELANGEIGTIQPVRAVARLVTAERQRRLKAGERRPIWLHTDASQAASALSVNVATLGCDLMTLSAAKVYGPKQVGLLWASGDVRLRPLVLGGGQEHGVRSGTENVAGAIGFARALAIAQQERREESAREAALRDLVYKKLSSAFPWARVCGPTNPRHRLPGLLHISFPGLDARRLVILLERRGVSVGTGSACAASRMRRSHVLEAIGLSEQEAAGSLRITLGRPTTEAEALYAADAISDCVTSELERLGVARGAAPASMNNGGVLEGGQDA